VKVRVDNEICDLHGQCVFAAPEIFSFDDNGELEYVTDIPDELAAKARAAAAVCPTGAIELTE
jgi:ferredoxin